MVSLPENVMNLVNDPTASKVVATIGAHGVHAIPVGSVIAAGPDMVAFGAILMKRTSKNLEDMQANGDDVSVVVMKEVESYEIKGAVTGYVTEGPLFDKMNENLKKIGLQARGVWTLAPSGVWNQSANYDAGKKIA